MTEKQQQTNAGQQQTQAAELEDTKLESVQGGVAIDGITRAGTKGTKGITDGTSN